VARPYPKEFRDDVVRVARNREDGVTIEQIAADFGVHPMTLWKWLRQADIDDGAASGKSTGESAELRELRRRNRLLEQENEVLRRATAGHPASLNPGGGICYTSVCETMLRYVGAGAAGTLSAGYQYGAGACAVDLVVLHHRRGGVRGVPHRADGPA
jgi:transposase